MIPKTLTNQSIENDYLLKLRLKKQLIDQPNNQK